MRVISDTMAFISNAKFRQPTEFMSYLLKKFEQGSTSFTNSPDLAKYNKLAKNRIKQHQGIDSLVSVMVIRPDFVEALRSSVETNYKKKVRRLNIPSHCTGC